MSIDDLELRSLLQDDPFPNDSEVMRWIICTHMLIYHAHKPALLHKFKKINPWKFCEIKFAIDKVIQRLLKVTTPIEYKKYMHYKKNLEIS